MINTILFNDKQATNRKYHEAINDIKSGAIKCLIEIQNPTVEELKILADDFRLHHLAIDDCIKRTKHSKIYDYKDHVFMIMNELKAENKSGFNTFYNYIFMSRNFLIIIRYANDNCIDDIFKLVKENEVVREKGIDFILYLLFNEFTGQYFKFIDRMELEIDAIERKTMEITNQEILNEIISMKRKILKLKRIVAPQRECLNMLLRYNNDIIDEKHSVYFSDIYEHMIRIYEIVDSFQEMLSSCLELYTSQQANKMNGIMKVLTIVTTILTPIAVMSSIYGMNFDNMPELRMKYGYFVFLLVALTITIVQVIFLRKKKWM